MTRVDHTQKRWANFKHDPEKPTYTPAKDHPAVRDGRTMYRGNVTAAAMMDRLLISGHNNRKIGKMVVKGPWSGMPIFTLTLEERATCPSTCHMWRDCYGNNMHWPRRIKHGTEFEHLLADEVARFAERHPKGFVVRLHVLGDFYSVNYALLWDKLLNRHPELHVYGYTARQLLHPIGRVIQRMNMVYKERCSIRWSVPAGKHEGMDAIVSTVAEDAVGPSEIVCPVDTDRTSCCANCGLCWSLEARHKTIVFLKHGRGVRK